MFVFGAHAFIWGTTSRTVRMRAVPLHLQGRVGSLYAIGVFGGIVAGQALGGVIARIWGLTAPFWFAFVGSAVLLALIWRALAHIAHADEEALAALTCWPRPRAGALPRACERWRVAPALRAAGCGGAGGR